MNTMCIDIGTQLGWAMDLSGKEIISGSECMAAKPKQHIGFRYVNVGRFMNRMSEQWPIDKIVFEDVKAHSSVQAGHVYGGILAMILAWSAIRDIPCVGVGVGTIKKHATGNGRASKDDMVDSAISRGYSPADDNEADAIAIAYLARDMNG